MDPVLVVSAALLFAVLVVMGRALFVPRITADDLFQRTDLAWPRGVQEEEPVAWQLDRLTLRLQPRPPTGRD